MVVATGCNRHRPKGGRAGALHPRGTSRRRARDGAGTLFIVTFGVAFGAAACFTRYLIAAKMAKDNSSLRRPRFVLHLLLAAIPVVVVTYMTVKSLERIQ
jgi:hypothetical protein